MPKKTSSKASTSTPTITPPTATTMSSRRMIDEDSFNRHEPQQPDIFRQEPPLPVKRPKAKTYGIFGRLVSLIAFIISIPLGYLVAFPIVGVVVIFFVILPRFIFKGIIWNRYSSEGIHLLPIGPSLAAAGYEFYSVVFIIKGEASLETVRARFQAILDAKRKDEGGLKYPSLRQRLVKRAGYFCIQEWSKIELRNHVSALEHPSEEDPLSGGMSQSKLFQLLQGDFKYGTFKVMRADAPQWEALVIPRFKYDVQFQDEEDGLVLVHQEMEPSEIPEGEDYYAIAFRAHSAILDKETAIQMLQNEFLGRKDASSVVRKRSSASGKLDGQVHKLLILGYALFLAPWTVFTRLLQGAPFSFGEHKVEKGKGKISEPFHLHSTRTLSLGGVQAAKNVSRTTVTSIIATCAGGAARNMILSQDKPLPSEIRFSLKQFPAASGVGGTRSSTGGPSILNFTLPSEMLSYPIDRLGHAFFIVAGHKHNLLRLEAKKWINSCLLWIIGAAPSNSGRLLYKWFHNVHILLELWNLDGPFQLFGSDLVVDIFGWNSIDGTWADFGITMTTYAGRLKANIIGDNAILGFGTKMRKNIIADEFLEEYTQIAMPCDIKPKYLYKPMVVGSDELYG